MEISSSKCFGGEQKVYEHYSSSMHSRMRVGIFFPSDANKPDVRLPVVYFLGDIFDDERSVMTLSGVQKYAQQYQMVIVFPDKSPKSEDLREPPSDGDFAAGASFYLDAVQDPWNCWHKMYTYITRELREWVNFNFRFVSASKVGITGFSMGGHGALIAFFRNPHVYKAVSAFSPIANPSISALTRVSFSYYLGQDQALWEEFDATELVKRQPQKTTTILIDQGDKDEWINLLMPDNFIEACALVDQPVDYRLRPGYDHSYFYVQTFVEEHMKFFSETL